MCKEQEDCKIFLSGINRWSIHDRLCDCIWLRENGCDFSKRRIFFIYLGILFVIALVDWHIQMIYDRFHIMILILAVLDFMLYPEMGIATRLTGMGIISVPMLVLALAIPGAFGGGDIKLMSVSGLLIGGASMICAMCIGIITGGAYVTLMLVRKRLNKTDQFAFGPFLAFGLATVIFLGDKMAVWYLQFGAV